MSWGLKTLFSGGLGKHEAANWDQLATRTNSLADAADRLATLEPNGLAGAKVLSQPRGKAMEQLLPLMQDWSERVGLDGASGAIDAAVGSTHVDTLRSTAMLLGKGGAEDLTKASGLLRGIANFAAHH